MFWLSAFAVPDGPHQLFVSHGHSEGKTGEAGKGYNSQVEVLTQSRRNAKEYSCLASTFKVVRYYRAWAVAK